MVNNLKPLLLKFFKESKELEFISYADLHAKFEFYTDFRYTTPTQFMHFKSVLVANKFLIEIDSKIFKFNWPSIKKTFLDGGS